MFYQSNTFLSSIRPSSNLLCLLGLFHWLVGIQASTAEELLPPPSVTAIVGYGIGEGLPMNCLQSIVRDQKGRLWVNPCSSSGVTQRLSFFQYDGERSLFHPMANTADSLLWMVFGETSDGFLYGSDQDRSAAFRWHPDTGERCFVQFSKEEEVLNVVQSPAGKLMILIRSGNLYRTYYLQADELELIAEISLDSTRNIDVIGWPIPVVWSSDDAWFIHETAGLVKLSLLDNSFQYYPWEHYDRTIRIDSLNINAPNGSLNWPIATLSDGRFLLYLGIKNGFFVYNPQTSTLLPHPLLNRYVPEEETYIELRVSFSRDNSGNILVSMDGRLLDQSLRAYTYPLRRSILLSSPGEMYDYTSVLESMSASAQYDNLGLSLGTFFGSNFQSSLGWASFAGLVMADMQLQLDIRAYPISRGARAIGWLDSSHLIVNTDDYTFKLNSKTGQYKSITEKSVNQTYLSSLVLGQDKQLWLAENDAKLIHYDFNTNALEKIKTEENFDKFLLLDKSKMLLLTRAGNAIVYHLENKTQSPYIVQNAPLQLRSVINDFLYIPDEELWIATGSGLWRVDLRNDQLEKLDQLPLLRTVEVRSINKNIDGKIWLGTTDAGVIILTPQTLEVQQLAVEQGLSNNVVTGILSDEAGNQWVATYDGITVISAQGEVLFVLSEENGLTDNEFNRTSFAKLPDGTLAFGGVNGINILEPEQVVAAFSERESLQIYLASLAYFDQNVQENRTFVGAEIGDQVIRIPAANRYLTLDFSLSDYVRPSDHSYSYRLLPQGRKIRELASQEVPWTTIGALNQLNLQNLPVGDYIVQVRGVDAKGKQSINPLEIPISVAEFFYRTWWFLLLCVLLVTSLVGIWVRRILTERQRLQVEVDRRTKQIRRDKEIIERQAEELRSLDETKSLFFANISHEFRTPLTIISGMADQIEKNPQRWVQEGTKMIRRNNDNLLDLINQILELQKLEAGKLRTNLELGDIIPFLRSIAEQFQAFSQSKLQTLEFKSTVDVLPMDFDAEKTLRIVSNLLSNAIKYTPTQGKVLFYVSQQLKSLGSDIDQLILRVQDTGRGIPADQLPYIFDRFYQATVDQEGTGVGSGIGLALTHQMVQLLDGSIEVASELGVGTTFTVSLPITQTANPTATPEEVVLQSKIFGQASHPQELVHATNHDEDLPLALIVEDNADVAQYLQICLEGSYRLELATDGQEGIDKALELIPDIIISDVMMPKMNGFELCDSLKEHTLTSHIPIILLTAKSDVDSRITGLKQGADDYLSKPFHEEELLVRMQNLLRLRAKLQERYNDLYAVPLTAMEEEVPTKEDEFILQIKEVVDQRIDDPDFDLNELSKTLFLSRSQLGRKVKALTGRSPALYIRSLRLQKARQLVLTTNASIKEIAYDVGFSNPIYFTRSYAEEFGESPTKTRDLK